METTATKNRDAWVRFIGLALFILGCLLAVLSAFGFHGFLRSEAFANGITAFLVVAGLRSFLDPDDDETSSTSEDLTPTSRTLPPGNRIMARRSLQDKSKF